MPSSAGYFYVSAPHGCVILPIRVITMGCFLAVLADLLVVFGIGSCMANSGAPWWAIVIILLLVFGFFLK